MAGEQNGGEAPSASGYDAYAPMPLGRRSPEELGLGPSAPQTWADGRPEYGGLPPYGTPYVPPSYPAYPSAPAPAASGQPVPFGAPPAAPPGLAGAPGRDPAQSIQPLAPQPTPHIAQSVPPFAQPTQHVAQSPQHVAQPTQHVAQPTQHVAQLPQAFPQPVQPLLPPPAYAGARRADGLPSWGWAVIVLVALTIIVVVVSAAARILAATPADDPTRPVAGATAPGAPTPGAAAPEGAVTLDASANLPSGTVLAMAESADWAPYDTVDPEHLLGPAAPDGEDSWRSPCYFALHSTDGAFGSDDREGSEYWGELAQKYAAPDTTASSIPSLFVPGPGAVLYEFSGYSEVSTGEYEKAAVSYTRADIAGDRTYEIAVRCDGTAVPQDVLDAVSAQFQLREKG